MSNEVFSTETNAEKPTHFHSFGIIGVYNLVTHKDGYKIVGYWGDPEKNEGNRIGIRYDESEYQLAEDALLELEAQFKDGPAKIEDVLAYLETKYPA